MPCFHVTPFILFTFCRNDIHIKCWSVLYQSILSTIFKCLWFVSKSPSLVYFLLTPSVVLRSELLPALHSSITVTASVRNSCSQRVFSSVGLKKMNQRVKLPEFFLSIGPNQYSPLASHPNIWYLCCYPLNDALNVLLIHIVLNWVCVVEMFWQEKKVTSVMSYIQEADCLLTLGDQRVSYGPFSHKDMVSLCKDVHIHFFRHIYHHIDILSFYIHPSLNLITV